MTKQTATPQAERIKELESTLLNVVRIAEEGLSNASMIATLLKYALTHPAMHRGSGARTVEVALDAIRNTCEQFDGTIDAEAEAVGIVVMRPDYFDYSRAVASAAAKAAEEMA